MSDEAPDQESKTEDPSQKKIEDARKKGDVVKSQEVVTWFMLLGSAMVFAMLGPSTSAQLMLSLETVLMNADQFELGGAGFAAFFNNLAFSLVAEEPRRAVAIAEGALMRLTCGERCFDRYRAHLWDGD